MLACVPAAAQVPNGFPVESGWTVLTAKDVQALSGNYTSDDKRFAYRFDFPNRHLTLTVLRSGELRRSSLTVHANGIVQDGYGGRLVVHAKQAELRICATDLPLTCWPLRRIP